MKSTILNIKKRVLVVEIPRMSDYEFINRDSKYLKVGNEEINLNISTLSKVDLICGGSELSEEIAKGLIKTEISDYLIEWNYNYKTQEELNEDSFSALDSFISAIEANGYYWKSHNVGKPNMSPTSEKELYDNQYQYEAFHEAESRTFNPSQTLIFEIL